MLESRVTIMRDDENDGPREWDNLGHMVCWHPLDSLGDETVSPRDFGPDKKSVLPDVKGLIYLPVYLYEHSGRTMNTVGFYCGFDSGQVGWIYVEPGKVKEEMGWTYLTQPRLVHIREMLQTEVGEYDQYLQGNCFGYKVEEVNICTCCKQETSRTEIDADWGFLGDDIETNGILDCLDTKLHDAARVAMQNVDR